MAAPTELRVSKDRRLLTVSYGDHAPFELPAELLRVLSPSAEVQGHSPEQRVTVPGKRNVAISRIEPVGNYAVRIVFDDMHDTGHLQLGLSAHARSREGGALAGLSRRARGKEPVARSGTVSPARWHDGQCGAGFSTALRHAGSLALIDRGNFRRCRGV